MNFVNCECIALKELLFLGVLLTQIEREYFSCNIEAYKNQLKNNLQDFCMPKKLIDPNGNRTRNLWVTHFMLYQPSNWGS